MSEIWPVVHTHREALLHSLETLPIAVDNFIALPWLGRP